MRLRLGKVTVADVLAAQPVTTNLLKFMRASIKMIGVSNLQRSEERFSRNAETDLVCRLLLEKKTLTLTLSPRLLTSTSKYVKITIAHAVLIFSTEQVTLAVVSYTFFFTTRPPPTTTLFPYTTLFRSAGKSYCSRRFGGATCDDKSAQIYARFDKNDWRIQPAEFYRFHDAEVNTFGYF